MGRVQASFARMHGHTHEHIYEHIYEHIHEHTHKHRHETPQASQVCVAWLRTESVRVRSWARSDDALIQA